ncbi:MAG: DUF4037 domain-containing protein [Oscillospiraceae bacterium]|nr:DUF4037 domain-containing protein [Oscillospiraceae bacterium]
MNGLETAERFYETCGKPMIDREFAQFADVIAAGLAGQGSECFGFDDEFSRDHDFGPGFILWIPERYKEKIGSELQRAYDLLPSETEAASGSIITPERAKRVGVMTTEQFYTNFTGRPTAPETNADWLRIPQRFLAEAVNGKVFYDPLGEFSAVRSALLSYYPPDVLKKKLAANCAAMGQAGQYNYVRCIKRGHYESAYLACCEFVKSALAALYLLNGTYMPFYKWAFKKAESFRSPEGSFERIKKLPGASDKTEGEKKIALIEEICLSVEKELVRRGLSDAFDDFIPAHAESLTKTIEDPFIRGLHITAGAD